MNYEGVTEASRKLHSLIRTTERTVIVKRNRPCAVLVSFDDYQNLVRAARRGGGEVAKVVSPRGTADEGSDIKARH